MAIYLPSAIHLPLYLGGRFTGSDSEPWHGYDFDGTLVEDARWVGPETCGEDFPRVCRLLANDLRAGKRVKIFTARMSSDPEILPEVERFLLYWSFTRFGVHLELTNVKDFHMVHCYDDRFTNPQSIS